MSYKMRFMTPSDAAAVQQIILDCGAGQGLPRWRESDVVDTLRANRGWVLEDQRGVVAFVLAQVLPEAWEILHLATSPKIRRQGLMRWLLADTISQRESNKQVWLEVHECNAPARALYESMGFKIVGHRPLYYPDGGAAVLYNLG